jgi:transposase
MLDVVLLSPAQMGWIKPFFPLYDGGTRVDGRSVVSGIVFVTRSGLRSRHTPATHGRRKTLYIHFV